MKLLLLSLILLLIVGCKDTPKRDEVLFPNAPDTSQSVDSTVISKLNDADQAYDAMRRINMTHTHGKDLAVNAHQDIPRKRRLLKRARELAPKKRAAYKRAQERRQKLLEEQKELQEKSRKLLE